MKITGKFVTVWLFGASSLGYASGEKIYAYKYNGKKIYTSDMDESLSKKFEAEYSQFQANVKDLIERDALDRFIKEEKQRIGFYLSSEDETLLETPVTEEEIKSYYEKHRNRLGATSYERAKEHLRTLLQTRRDKQMRGKVLQALQSQEKISIGR